MNRYRVAVFCLVLFASSASYSARGGHADVEAPPIIDSKEDAILGPAEMREPTLYTGFPTVSKNFVWDQQQAEKISEICKTWRLLKERELQSHQFAPLFSECRLRHRPGTPEFYYEAYIVFRSAPAGQKTKDETLVVSVPAK